MADVYGERIGQGLDDEEWISDAGRRGWVVLRAFCLTNANLRGVDQPSGF